ncbi:Oligosaccharide translocation protein rft1 [Malassezia cuniculi]|uniref:Man(5)GlcNAc(2)-PP-dolichol translocation protein RFT1 n=1 Tax=Malassezia cuniculi TaxID=948313 RepID=A0AAF0EVM2_9BASI|nr:Oligosaccharide translocation protein rft1 [Malassezia cuniculi]
MSTVWRVDQSLGLSSSLARHAVPRERRFLVALEWRRTLLGMLRKGGGDGDGDGDGDGGSGVSLATCLAIAYACHAPYVLSAPHAPQYTQPFRSTVQVCADEAARVSSGAGGNSRFADLLRDARVAQFVVEAFSLLLGDQADVDHLGKFSPDAIIAGKLNEHIGSLIDTAQKRKLSLAEWRRLHTNPQKISSDVEGTLMRIGEHNAGVVPCLVLANYDAVSAQFFVELGKSYGQKDIVEAKHLLAGLLRSEHAQDIQEHLLPSYFHEYIETRKLWDMGEAPDEDVAVLYLMILGVRLVTFVLNQLLVRSTLPAVYGAANVQLELVLSVVVFTARDSIRSVALRKPRQTHDLVLAAVPAGALAAACTSVWYLRALVPPELAAYGPTLAVSVGLYYVGAVFELAAEPFLLTLVGRDSFVGVRVAMEAAGVLGRACATAVLLTSFGLAALTRFFGAWGMQGTPAALSLAAYGVGKAVYGLAMCAAAFVGAARSVGVRSALHAYVPQWRVDGETRSLASYTLLQSLTKQTLAEGDKLAVAQLAPLSEQGGYALASNYGSLVARILFQPVEESARLFFAGAPRVADSAQLLHNLLRGHVLFALALLTFGPPLSHVALIVLAGQAWAFGADGAPSAASRILARYCYYLPVMGINGVVEAYMQSVAPPAALARYSYVLFGSSAAFVAVLWVLRRFIAAEDALIAANACSLGVRAAASWAWTRWHMRQTDREAAARVGAGAIMPRASVLAAFALAAALLRQVAAPVGLADIRALAARAFRTDDVVCHMATATVGGLLLVGSAMYVCGI